MKQFSITQLETARKNPQSFGKNLKDAKASENTFGGYPKSMRWLNAICIYHQNENISDAILSIENSFSNRKDTLKNRNELEGFINSIVSYESETKKRNLIFIKSRERINLILNNQIKVTGIIPLIFMKPTTGFAAYFISKSNANWQSELKYPIVQNYVAKYVFDSEIKNVDIGYIDYFTGELIEDCFSLSSISSAKEELQMIGEEIALNL